jgi:hypothetical protein
LLGWASHFLMPARMLYSASITLGVVGGLVLAFALSERNQSRLFLLAIWPIGVVTVFFSAVGTFNFSEMSFAELLNFEFAFMWGGAVWALLVLKPRRSTVFDERRATLPSLMQKPLYAQPRRQSYFIPDQASLADAERAFAESADPTGDERTQDSIAPDSDSNLWVSLDEAHDATGSTPGESLTSRSRWRQSRSRRLTENLEIPALDNAVEIDEALNTWKDESENAQDSHNAKFDAINDK